MAVEGLTPKKRISIGVISAPPPAPVMPTRKPDDSTAEDDVGVNRHRRGSRVRLAGRSAPSADGSLVESILPMNLVSYSASAPVTPVSPSTPPAQTSGQG